MSESCPKCGGDGIFDGEECSHCGGDGVFTKHSPANVTPSYIILEALNATEYNALTAAKKANVLLLLAC